VSPLRGSERCERGLLIAKLEGLKPARPAEERRKGYCAEQIRDHGATTAERVIKAAETVFVLDVEDWEGLPKGDWRKGSVAGLIRASALVPNG
jgi:hypothetical protein